jgi:hypothetical protein
MPKIITPTIGRRLWYWPSAYDCGKTAAVPPSTIDADATQPCDAGVCYVHGDRLVNLTVADHNGNMHRRTSVTLLQEGDEIPVGQAYAEWMPYQAAQAKRQESATT